MAYNCVMTGDAERWRPYPNFAGFYEVSDLGNVFSLPRTTTPGGLLDPHVSGYGYRIATLSKYGRTYYRRVGRMVLETWVSPCPPGKEACHGPAGSLVDRLANLYWGTKEQNYGPDRVRDGTSNRGERCATAKLTAEIVIACRRRYAAGETQSALAVEFSVSQSALSLAIRGKRWAHLDEPPVPGIVVQPRSAKWTEEIVLECRRRYAAGETQAALAAELGVDYGAMNRAIRGRTWSHLTEGLPDPEDDGRHRPLTPEMRENRQEYGRKGARSRWG